MATRDRESSSVVGGVPPRSVTPLRPGQRYHRIAGQLLGAVPPLVGCVPGRIQAERAERHVLVRAGRHVSVEADAEPPPLEHVIVARLLLRIECGTAYEGLVRVRVGARARVTVAVRVRVTVRVTVGVENVKVRVRVRVTFASLVCAAAHSGGGGVLFLGSWRGALGCGCGSWLGWTPTISKRPRSTATTRFLSPTSGTK